MLTRSNPYHVELHGADDLGNVGWPRAADDAEWRFFVFQCREFLEVWFQTMGQARGSEAVLVVVRDREGTPLLYLPLCVERRLGASILRFPDGGVSDYCAPVVRRGVAFESGQFNKLWHQILEALPPVDLISLCSLADRIVDIPNPLAKLGASVAEGQGTYVEVGDSWETYVSDTERQALLSQAARKLRKLSAKGTVAFEKAGATSSDSSGWIDFILEQKSRQYLRTLGMDVLALPGYQAFFRKMAEPEQLCHVSTLDALLVDGEPAAGHLGYSTPSRGYYILIAADFDRFGKYSVGTSLFTHLLDRSVTNGQSAYDLGKGFEPYKDSWATGEYQLSSYTRALTLKGSLAANAMTAKESALGQRLDRLRARLTC